MIRQEFESEKEVIFEYDGSVSLPTTMSAAEFAEFMPLAMLVYHKNMPPPGYGLPMGPAAVNKPAAKKRGRPAIKSAVAKRGRPRKA